MNSHSKCYLLIIVLIFKVLCFSQAQFKDITNNSGIQHQFVVLEGMFGGGVCVFDYNNDGFEDLYITSGLQQDKLYRNNGNKTFTNIFTGSGLEITDQFVTQGVASADINNDGRRDLLVTTITKKNTKLKVPRAQNLLFLNLGNGKFKDVTQAYGLNKYLTFSTSASFGDINKDGWVDIFIGNYFDQTPSSLKEITDAVVVGANQIASPNLLINKNGTHFEDGNSEYGIDFKGFGFGGVFTDYDNDGDLDILVNHDFGYKRTPNKLLENKYPFKKFVDVAKRDSIDLKINAMGAAVGDINNDGLLDYYVTNIRSNKFMIQQADNEYFKEMSASLGTGITAISWGAVFADFDHDTDLDLFVANGDLNPNCNPMNNFYFENTRGKYIESALLKGVADYGIGRGVAVFDLENDGDLDLIIVNQKPVLPNYPIESISKIFENVSNNSGNYLKIKLIGEDSNKDGLGARVLVELANGQILIREVDGGASSQYSQHSNIVHFGVGTQQIKSIKILWTTGNEQIITNGKINSLITVQEEPSRNYSVYVASIFFIMSVIYALSKYKIITKNRA